MMGVCGQMLVLLRALGHQAPSEKWFPREEKGMFEAYSTTVETLPSRDGARRMSFLLETRQIR